MTFLHFSLYVIGDDTLSLLRMKSKFLCLCASVAKRFKLCEEDYRKDQQPADEL